MTTSPHLANVDPSVIVIGSEALHHHLPLGGGVCHTGDTGGANGVEVEVGGADLAGGTEKVVGA